MTEPSLLTLKREFTVSKFLPRKGNVFKPVTTPINIQDLQSFLFYARTNNIEAHQARFSLQFLTSKNRLANDN